MSERNAREVVLDILLELAKGKEYSHVVIGTALDRNGQLEERERAFVKRVSAGTIERRIQLDYVLDRYAKTPVQKMKPLIRELLRMSVYQLLFLEHVPDAAVCNEAVKLAKKRGFQNLQGFVNGVLRNIARGRAEIPYPDREKDRAAYLSVRYAMPPWLVAHFDRHYGEEACERMLAAFLEDEGLSLRLGEGLSGEERDALTEAWEAAGVEVARHPFLPYAVTLRGVNGIRSLAGFGEGLFAVQDVSSMLVVEAAGIRPGDTVIDVCASPGGKALHAAEKLRGTGQVIACDVSPAKAERIAENQARLGLHNITVRVADARLRTERFVEKADVLLADLPCSGLGVMGRKQDIRHRVTEQSLAEVASLQREILSNVVSYVKPGGILMYSTCTLNPAENEEMAAWICEQFGFAPVSMAQRLPVALAEQAERGMVQLLPGIHGTDGFFLAKLRRAGDAPL